MKVSKAHFLAAGLTAATLGLASPALGVAVTDTADFNLSLTPSGDGPPLPGVFTLSYDSNSRVVTNTYTPPVGGMGGDIRSVGVLFLTSAAYPDQDSNNFFVAGPNSTAQVPTSVVGVFGIQGTVQDTTGGTVTARFNEGKIAFFEIPLPSGGSFSLNDPTTWGFTSGTLLGEYGLAAPETVVSGHPNGTDIATIPGNIVNRSAVNSQTGNENQGRFLVSEADASTHPDGKVFPAVPFQTNVLPEDNEGLFFFLDQEVLNPATGVAVANSGAKQMELDKIAEWAFGDEFANWVAADTTNYAPGIDPGDFTAQVGGVVYPVAIENQIPEPATMSLLALGSLGLLARRRRNA